MAKSRESGNDEISRKATLEEAFQGVRQEIRPLPDNPAMESGNEGDDLEIRQSEILKTISKFGGQSIHIKDIAQEFPGISERTLRYDLHKLCNQGAVRKTGNGPSTFYQLVGR